jgi:outer membrane usher protein
VRARARRINDWRWIAAGWLFLCQLGLAEQPPTTAFTMDPSDAPAETTLYLDLMVNGELVGKVVPVRQIGQELFVHARDLHAAGVSIPEPSDAHAPWLSLERTPGIQHRYDANALLLDVTVPAHWFAEQFLLEQRRSALESVSSPGLGLNYAAHLSDGEERAKVGSLWSEWRLFNGAGVFTHTGVHRYVAESAAWSGGGRRRRGYVRFDTAWSSSNEDQLHSWTVGDLITSAQSWSMPVRVAGVQFSRDFRLRPDLITYPLPQFSGQATLPSTLDLFINGQRVRSEHIRPGPYTLSSVPFLTGAGEATLVTTDVLGRQVATTLPFYASSELLRQGLSDYSVCVGVTRRDYGIEDFSYGRFASTGSLRYGLTNAITIEGQAELAPTSDGRFGLLGLGTVMKVGTLGMVSASVSHSANDQLHGRQWSFGYRYSNRGVNFGYQGTRSTKAFYSLANADAGGAPPGPTRSDIVTAGVSSERIGSFAISYVRVQSMDDEPARLFNVSYSRHVSGALSLRIGASRDLQRDEGLFTTQLLASFGSRGNLTLGAEQGGGSRESFRYARNVPSYGGIGWNMGRVSTADGRTHSDASVAWSGRYARLETGVATDAEQHVGWVDLRGSFLVMDDDVFAARQVSDAFVVVSTDGVSEVPVRYENQLVGYTNRRGRLLVPSVTSHYQAKFSIDAARLPPEISIDEPEQRIAVRRRSGALLNFDMRRTSGALIKLVDSDGAVVPVGSHAREQFSGQAGTVGYDGLVYFENPQSRVAIDVQRADGSACHAELQLQPGASALVQLGPITCEHVP